MIGYIAGWDGGGTKTMCEVRSLDGEKTLRFAAGPLNPNGTAKGQSDATVNALLNKMLTLPGGLNGCKMLCIGTAGISNPDTVQCLCRTLKNGGYTGAVCFTGDQQTALYGALGQPCGAVLIAGTGSICYGQNSDGLEARTGGWGSLMDDEGGGYALGRDILAAVVRSEDGRCPKTCLREDVFNYFKVDSINEMIGRIYAPGVGKKEIAKLSPLLDEALKRKDVASMKIRDKAAIELALMVRPVIKKLRLQNMRLALAGSVLLNCLPIREATIEKIEIDFPELSCVSPMQDAASGAVLMAKKVLEENEGYSVLS